MEIHLREFHYIISDLIPVHHIFPGNEIVGTPFSSVCIVAGGLKENKRKVCFILIELYRQVMEVNRTTAEIVQSEAKEEPLTFAELVENRQRKKNRAIPV